MKVLYTLIAVWFLCSQTIAQDINFDDLRRPGKPLSKSYTVKGAGADGNNAIMKFMDMDMRRIEREKASGSKGRYCYLIHNDDKRYLCLAHTSRDRGFCYSIRREDMRLECVASFDGRSGCYLMRDSDKKWACLAQYDGRKSCFAIRNDDERWACLAQFDGKSNCYSIRNEDDRWLCLATLE